jgi:hypothetical protein
MPFLAFISSQEMCNIRLKLISWYKFSIDLREIINKFIMRNFPQSF